MFVCYLCQLWLLLKQTKWAGLNNSISSVFVCGKEMANSNCMNEMEWNLFCSLSSIGQIIWVDALLNRLYKELQSFGNTFTLIFIRTLAERKWHRHVVVSLSPGENCREHLEVFHKCTLFWSCHIAVQVSPVIITYPGYLPHLLTNFFLHGVTAAGPLGGPPGNWTAGSSCLEEDWRWYLGGGP